MAINYTMCKRNTVSGPWVFILRKVGNLDAPLTMPNNHFTDLLMPFWGKYRNNVLDFNL